MTSDNDNETTSTNTSPETEVNLVFQYTGILTENLIKQLKCSNGPVQQILTLRKQKRCLPSLKPKDSSEESFVKEQLRSHVLYKLTCPGCQA